MEHCLLIDIKTENTALLLAACTPTLTFLVHCNQNQFESCDLKMAAELVLGELLGRGEGLLPQPLGPSILHLSLIFLRRLLFLAFEYHPLQI